MVFLASPVCLLAQEDDTKFPLDHFYVKRKKSPRGLFKNFRFGLSVGYGNTFFSHQLKDSLGIYQRQGKAPVLFNNTASVRYSNWVNRGTLDTLATEPGSFQVRSDTTKIGFKALAFNIPIRATIHYEYKIFRIGAGYSYEYMSLGTFAPTAYKDEIGHFKPARGNGFMQKYFGSLGASFARWEDYLFTGDLNIGGFKPGKNFNNSAIKKGIYVNIGVTAERELSEYLRVFARPSFEFKSYTLNSPDVPKPIQHHMNAWYLNVGITYAIPDLPRCFVKVCRIQINHAHGNKEYRSRVHSFLKKQNPGYGEDRPLIKDKGKNKTKMNPY